jgi:hypothetical protein
MTRSRRGRMHDPEAFCDRLRPARQACIDQMRHLAISGPEYAAMQAIIGALDHAAFSLTGRKDFFFRHLGLNTGQRSDAGT